MFEQQGTWQPWPWWTGWGAWGAPTWPSPAAAPPGGGAPWPPPVPAPPPLTGAEDDPPPAYTLHRAREFAVQDLQGISRATQEQHLGLYRGYVQNTNEARRDLFRQPAHETADPNYSAHRSRRLGEIWNWNGAKNHEMYFSVLSPRPRPLAGALRDLIVRDFGSVERFLADFKAAARAMRGWVMLAYDLDDGRLHIFGGDGHDHAVWNTVVLMGIDVFEHAYFMDRGRDRGPYIDAFLANLDWGAVEERARRYGVIQ